MPHSKLTPTANPSWLRLLLGLIVALMGLAVLGGPALAQEDDDSGGEQPEEVTEDVTAAETLGGRLQARDDSGERVPIEGVSFIVRDSDDNTVAEPVTDADGVWLAELPSSGIYSVELVVETLPEGNSLRDPDRNPLTGVAVQPGTSKNVLFAMGDRQGSDDNTVVPIQLLADGIKLGLIIAMCSIGLSLIFGTTGLTNFAHGESVTLGAMIAYMFHMVYGSANDFAFFGLFDIWADGRLFGIPGTNSLIFGAIMAVIICGISGWLLNKYVWKKLRFRGASLISALVVSIGLAIFFRYVFLFLFAGRARFYRDYQIQSRVDLGWFSLAPKDIFIILFSTFTLLCVGLALQRTRAGKAMRAVADNRDLAESSGIDVEAVIMWVWITGSALAGLGGVLFAMTESVSWEMGFRLLLLMFAGVTLGGLGTAYGAFLGSVLVGIFIQMITWPDWFPSDMKNVGALAALVLILLIRPQGLLGRSERIG